MDAYRAGAPGMVAYDDACDAIDRIGNRRLV